MSLTYKKRAYSLANADEVVYIPPPGKVDPTISYYATLNDETLNDVSEKLGCDNWHEIAVLEDNIKRYGKLRAATKFRKGTLLAIPEGYSNWKVKSLIDVKGSEVLEKKAEEKIICHICRISTSTPRMFNAFIEEPILLCDGCDVTCHLLCANLLSIPEGDWFCKDCLSIFYARQNTYSYCPQASLIAPSFNMKLPPVGKLNNEHQVSELRKNLKKMLTKRFTLEMDQLRQSHLVIRSSREVRITELINTLENKRQTLLAYLVAEVRTYELEKEITSYRIELNKLKLDMKNSPETEYKDEESLVLEYAGLLEQSQHLFETKSHYKNRDRTKLLGYVIPMNENELNCCDMLREPDELIIFVPLEEVLDLNKLVIGNEYAVFSRGLLFDRERDDELPIHKYGIRDAQRTLMALLIRRNADLIVLEETKVPSSVHPRESFQDISSVHNLFDLTDLVRDCNCDLDLPREATPDEMAKNGLKLHDYQEASLRWMMDKERNENILGLAGELWSRKRFFGDDEGHYFYCELTGSFALDIFDAKKDMEDNGVSCNLGGMPTGGILGEEMGLGKTLICLALVVRNPPPKANRVLPREYIWAREGNVVKHLDYRPPPRVSGLLLSNATLIVVPMTLMSQWESEIEQYAPWLKVIVLHCNTASPEDIASADICIVSYYLLQQSSKNNNFNKKRAMLLKIKNIHWHRIIIDESHYNQSGNVTKHALTSLSATHRFCVTGTPIGHSLDDLQGQLSFLRVPPFNRKNFWENNISNPYSEHNIEALRIIRTLLSHVVIRHSKEQTLANGEAMIELPPRLVETTLLSFGSPEEENLYKVIDKRNQEYFKLLQRDSSSTVNSKYIDLIAMMMSARQACIHMSMIDLFKYDNANKNIDPKWYEQNFDPHVSKTRKTILDEAIGKARPSVRNRVRKIIDGLQNGDMKMIECTVCLDDICEKDVCITPCGHGFCAECLLNIMQTSSRTREAKGHCPICRDIITRSELTFLGDAQDSVIQVIEDRNEYDKEEDIYETHGFSISAKSNVVTAINGSSTLRAGNVVMRDKDSRYLLPTISQYFLDNYDKGSNTIGTKISQLLLEIDTMIENDDTSKCVVFSQFNKPLDIAGEELKARNIRFVKINGNVPFHKRADALFEFSTDKNVKIFLLSMRSGAVGLNLTAANHCFLLDVPQNSASEEQAIERIHRIGQTRPVIVKRFVMQGTVEERILNVRRKLMTDKNPVANAALSINENNDVSGRQHDRIKFLTTLFGC